MLSIGIMGRHSGRYYLDLGKYYLNDRGKRRRRRKGRGSLEFGPFEYDDDSWANVGAIDPDDLPGEASGRWMGSGAVILGHHGKLGLHGVIHPDEYRSLLQGFHHVSKEPLVQNAGKENRRTGYDLVFSVDKSITLMWCNASPWERKLIEQFLIESAEETIAYIENTGLVYSRTGRGGYQRVNVGLVVAAFVHGTSRALEPQLHIHCNVMNLGVDKEGKTRSIEASGLFYEKTFLGAFQRAAFCHKFRDLGYELRRERSTVKVKGSPKDLEEEYSTRREQILAELRRQGTNDARVAQAAAFATRQKKVMTPPRNELFEEWQFKNAEFGFTHKAQQKLKRNPRPATERELREALFRARESLLQSRSHFKEKDFLKEVLLEGAALGIRPEPLLHSGREFLQDKDNVVSLGWHEDQERYTSQKVLDDEAFLLREFDKLRQRAGRRISQKILDSVLAKYPSLTDEQTAAIKHFANDSLSDGRAWRALDGLAGTGKTHRVLKPVVEMFKQAGIPVIAIAPTGVAVQQLDQAFGVQDFEAKEDARIKASIRRKQAASRRKKAANRRNKTRGRRRQLRPLGIKRKYPRRRAIDRLGVEVYTAARVLGDFPNYTFADRVRWGFLNPPRAMRLARKHKSPVVIVDEAAMVGTLTMARLLEWANKNDATVLPLGDWRQTPPVERGTPLRSLQERGKCLQLRKAIRQVTPEAQSVVSKFAEGKTVEALQMLNEQGRVYSHESVDDTVAALAERWVQYMPEKVLVLANTNKQVEMLNDNLQAASKLHRPMGALPAAIKHRDPNGTVLRSNVYIGDRILCTMNSKRLGVMNGQLGTVQFMSPLRDAIAIRLDTGRNIVVDVHKYPYLRRGYAVTTPRSQGTSVEVVFIYVEATMQNYHTSYTQLSRSQAEIHLYTNHSLFNPGTDKIDKSQLVTVMSRRIDLRLATDLLEKWRNRLRSVALRDIPPERKRNARQGGSVPQAPWSAPSADNQEAKREQSNGNKTLLAELPHSPAPVVIESGEQRSTMQFQPGPYDPAKQMAAGIMKQTADTSEWLKADRKTVGRYDRQLALEATEEFARKLLSGTAIVAGDSVLLGVKLVAEPTKLFWASCTNRVQTTQSGGRPAPSVDVGTSTGSGYGGDSRSSVAACNTQQADAEQWERQRQSVERHQQHMKESQQRQERDAADEEARRFKGAAQTAASQAGSPQPAIFPTGQPSPGYSSTISVTHRQQMAR